MHRFQIELRRGWLQRCSVALAILLTAVPVEAQPAKPRPWEQDSAYEWQMWFLYLFAYGYAFAFGASLASFLNVVVYRLPRGLNLVHPGSRCPACGTPIEARDNIPVFGWLALRGQCRTCGVPIAPRYLLIELAIGGLFVLLLHLAVFRGGIYLPGGDASVRHGPTILYSNETWQLGRVALYHACLLSLLLVCGLIQYDRQRVPGALWGVIIGIGLVAALYWPTLRPLAADGASYLAAGTTATARRALVDGLCGLLAGGAGGAALSLAIRSQGRWPQARLASLGGLASVGAYLGWQAALGVALLAAAGMAATSFVTRFWRWLGRLPPLCLIVAAAWLFVPLWRWLTELALQLHYAGSLLAMWGMVASLALALVARMARPADSTTG